MLMLMLMSCFFMNHSVYDPFLYKYMMTMGYLSNALVLGEHLNS